MDLPIPSPNPNFYAKIKRQEAWSALPNHSIRVAQIGSAVVGQALQDSRVGSGPSRFYDRQPPLRLWASCTGPASRAAAGGWGVASRAAACHGRRGADRRGNHLLGPLAWYHCALLRTGLSEELLGAGLLSGPYIGQE